MACKGTHNSPFSCIFAVIFNKKMEKNTNWVTKYMKKSLHTTSDTEGFLCDYLGDSLV